MGIMLPVEALVQPQLVDVVPDESRGPAKHEQRVQDAHLQVLVGFLQLVINHVQSIVSEKTIVF